MVTGMGQSDAGKEDFERVLEGGAELQRHLPWLQLVVVGGAMAALHANHRYSLDTDHVSQSVHDWYDEVIGHLESWDGWETKRTRRPFLILGERHHVQLGIRQQRGTTELDVERLRGMWVPTAAEALRIKVFMVTDRKATRDYLDVAALADMLGTEGSDEALRTLNVHYPGEGNQTCATKFADYSQQDPVDLPKVDLKMYRALKPPYDDWRYLRETVSELGHRLLAQEMEGYLRPGKQGGGEGKGGVTP